jgi:dTDP-4-amino-4,6-dideoxygalactose transaminase
MFHLVEEFENKVADFFGSPYAVATDSCTHAIELCLRLKKHLVFTIPKRTYLSIPMTAIKLGAAWGWTDDKWQEYYFLGNTNIVDAATMWREKSYIPNTFMCLSFQFKKHLALGRGGIILLDNRDDYIDLKKMSYDGRDLSKPWVGQDITTIGYHYYMTPETAQLGIDKLPSAIEKTPKIWSHLDYPDLSKYTVFNG